MQKYLYETEKGMAYVIKRGSISHLKNVKSLGYNIYFDEKRLYLIHRGGSFWLLILKSLVGWAWWKMINNKVRKKEREKLKQFEGKTPEQIVSIDPDSQFFSFGEMKSAKFSRFLFSKHYLEKTTLKGIHIKLQDKREIILWLPKVNIEQVKNILKSKIAKVTG